MRLGVSLDGCQGSSVHMQHVTDGIVTCYSVPIAPQPVCCAVAFRADV